MIESVRNASARKASAGLRGFFGFFGGRLPPAPEFVFITQAAQETHIPPSWITSAAVFCASERDACTRSARLCGCTETGATGTSHERGVEPVAENDSEGELLVCIQIY